VPELDRARATAFADTVDALYGVISDQRRAATDHSRRMKWMLSIVVGALLMTVAIGITQTVLLMRLTRETTAQQHRIEQMMQNQQAAMTRRPRRLTRLLPQRRRASAKRTRTLISLKWRLATDHAEPAGRAFAAPAVGSASHSLPVFRTLDARRRANQAHRAGVRPSSVIVAVRRSDAARASSGESRHLNFPCQSTSDGPDSRPAF
jgi:hypothetical protein